MDGFFYGVYVFLSLLLRDVPGISYIWPALCAAVILIPSVGLVCAVTGTSFGKLLRALAGIFRHLFRPPDR